MKLLAVGTLSPPHGRGTPSFKAPGSLGLHPQISTTSKKHGTFLIALKPTRPNLASMRPNLRGVRGRFKPFAQLEPHGWILDPKANLAMWLRALGMAWFVGPVLT
ncbi:hypothetical protein CRG98_027395 [Punica granatum]|uniref:Uncharacterized protein n=1 Tax=Punica granatum TaxID=22663 RepID=A0A2I0J8K2_PUNGR|nr:hypothetical protein CRG98_027395 [Punica granatum]